MIPKVLIVADSPFQRSLMGDLLEANRVRTERAATAREAMDRARSFAPDLVVVDVDMPKGESSRFLSWFSGKKETRKIPVIAVADRRQQKVVGRALNESVADWVEKPIDTCSFSRRVLRAMRRLTGAASS